MSQIFQIHLNQIQYRDQKLRDKISGKYLLSFNLIYPRSGIKSVETIKELKLDKKEVFLFRNRSFKDKVIFKEEIQGDCVLEVQIAISKEPSKFYEVIDKLVEKGILAGIGLITGGAGVSIATAIAKKTTESIFENADRKNKTIVLGKKLFPISESYSSDTINLDLKVPKAVKVYSDIVIKDGDRVKVNKLLVKGFHIATITLDVKRLINRPILTA